MKIKLNLNQLINLGISMVAIVAILYFTSILFFVNNSSSVSVSSTTVAYLQGTKLKPIDSVPLNYYNYKSLVENYKQFWRLKNGSLVVDGTTIGWFLGVKKAKYCDTCAFDEKSNSFSFSVYTDKRLTKHYLELPAWQLKGYSYTNPYSHPEFHVEHGQAYIRKSVVQKDAQHHKVINEIDIPVKFWYDSQSNSVLIPVKPSVTKICNILINVVFVSVVTYLFYLIALFLKFVIDVSRGLIFTSKNLKRLKRIAFGLLGMAIINIPLAYIARVIFNSYFTSDLELKSGVWGSLWPTLPMGIVFLLLFKAFKQGNTLKEESDLTV